jgi:hypothetical protein
MGRMTLMSDRFLEERLGCGHIAPVAQPEMHRVPGSVHCLVEVHPSPTDLDIGIGFVDSPRSTGEPLLKQFQRLMNSGVYRRTQRRIVVCATCKPRSAIISTRSRKLSSWRRYQRTHKMITSRSKCLPANSSSSNTIVGTGFGEINRTANNSRQIQLSLKIEY